MRTCPTCETENDDFAVVCSQCKGYLQNRVPNLDLFETAWGILHAPVKTFRRIALAEHKNYVLVLFGLFGISLSYTAFWYFKIGERFDTLLDVIIWALLAGIPLGLILFPLLTLLYWSVMRVFGVNGSFRNSYSVLAYSFVPVVLTLPLVLPVELLTFGMYLFTSNPSPMVIKPSSFVILAGFDGAMALWTLLLTVIGTVIIHRVSIPRAIGVIGSVLLILATVVFLASRSFTTVLS